MRILLTTDVVGGVWTYAAELAGALAARGHAVGLLALGGAPGAEQRAALAPHPEVELAVLDCPLEWMPEPEPGISRSAEALRALVARFRPDVVHLNQYYYGACELGVPKLVVAHSDVVSWWRAVRGEEPPDDAWFRRYRGWVRAGLAGATARVAPSRWMAAQAAAIYGAGGVRVVPNARAPEHFPGRPPHAREPLVVAAGRLWDEGKGARDLAAAATRLARAGGHARVVVAGPARHPAGGTDFPVDAPGLRWAGLLPPAELTALLGRAAVYAATSRYEPFGLAPLEAALAGCALVMSDIPTFRELWDGAALFYPPGDDAALAGILQELLGHGEHVAALAAAARERALQRFHPARMAAAYEAIYAELARHAADPRTRPTT